MLVLATSRKEKVEVASLCKLDLASTVGLQGVGANAGIGARIGSVVALGR